MKLSKEHQDILVLFIFLLTLFTQVREQTIQCLENPDLTCLSRNKYLTVQSNWLVAIWSGVYLLRRNSPNREQLKGKLFGAVTSYMTLVSLAYTFLIAPTDPTFNTFSNISLHFVIPGLMVIAWILIEDIRYEWNFLRSWIIYPFVYSFIPIVNGSMNWDLGYVYGFLNVSELGWGNVILTYIYIYVAYLLIGTLYIFFNHKLTKPTELL